MSTKHEGFTPGPWRYVVPIADNASPEQFSHVLACCAHLSQDRAPVLFDVLLAVSVLKVTGDFAEGLDIDQAIMELGGLLSVVGDVERLRDTMTRVAGALEADGRKADGCTKASAAIRLRAALTESDA